MSDYDVSKAECMGDHEEAWRESFHADDLPPPFKCPECGGSMFGTSRDGTTTTGHCHDYKDSGDPCRFQWSRPDEDYKVFKSDSVA